MMLRYAAATGCLRHAIDIADISRAIYAAAAAC